MSYVENIKNLSYNKETTPVLSTRVCDMYIDRDFIYHGSPITPGSSTTISPIGDSEVGSTPLLVENAPNDYGIRGVIAGNNILTSLSPEGNVIITSVNNATAANIGSGVEIYQTGSTGPFNFKTLQAGTGISISSTSNSVVLSGNPTNQSVGGGNPIYKVGTSNPAQFRSLTHSLTPQSEPGVAIRISPDTLNLSNCDYSADSFNVTDNTNQTLGASEILISFNDDSSNISLFIGSNEPFILNGSDFEVESSGFYYVSYQVLCEASTTGPYLTSRMVLDNTVELCVNIDQFTGIGPRIQSSSRVLFLKEGQIINVRASIINPTPGTYITLPEKCWFCAFRLL